jgi:hypothetical protein
LHHNFTEPELVEQVDVPPMRIGMQNGMVANIAVVGGLLLLLRQSGRQVARLGALGIAQAIRGPDSEVDRGSSGSSWMWSAVRPEIFYSTAHTERCPTAR